MNISISHFSRFFHPSIPSHVKHFITSPLPSLFSFSLSAFSLLGTKARHCKLFSSFIKPYCFLFLCLCLLTFFLFIILGSLYQCTCPLWLVYSWINGWVLWRAGVECR
ncbi:hypothetical protein B0J11DRAFT_92618 [Dendryphion nanum]|uniref:Uncharacterized protein n=1 Tax=Dendryphion nanum TaxID=256645 RepID=A0A9P9IEH5_9PLEO|nr:hypothetical protein B0J11DRAFT_92618 [Dendryphion nanum]